LLCLSADIYSLLAGSWQAGWKILEGEHLGVLVRRMTLERATIEGNSPVFENHFALLVILLEYHEA